MKKILTIIMTAALMVTLAIPTFAAGYPTNVPDVPEQYKNYDHIIYTNTNGETLLIIPFRTVGSEKYPLSPSNDFIVRVLDSRIYLMSRDSNTYGYEQYIIYNDGWFIDQTGDISAGGSTSAGSAVAEFNYSTLDIVDKDYNVVFPLPPSIAQILTEEVPSLVVSPMMKTLSILVPFGVGLMALLICLPILRKVFYQFQVK